MSFGMCTCNQKSIIIVSSTGESLYELFSHRHVRDNFYTQKAYGFSGLKTVLEMYGFFLPCVEKDKSVFSRFDKGALEIIDFYNIVFMGAHRAIFREGQNNSISKKKGF